MLCNDSISAACTWGTMPLSCPSSPLHPFLPLLFSKPTAADPRACLIIHLAVRGGLDVDLWQGDWVRTGAGTVPFWLLELSALLLPWLLTGVATGGMAMLNGCASLSHWCRPISKHTAEYMHEKCVCVNGRSAHTRSRNYIWVIATWLWSPMTKQSKAYVTSKNQI